jgi:hypothetical protein
MQVDSDDEQEASSEEEDEDASSEEEEESEAEPEPLTPEQCKDEGDKKYKAKVCWTLLLAACTTLSHARIVVVQSMCILCSTFHFKYCSSIMRTEYSSFIIHYCDPV